MQAPEILLDSISRCLRREREASFYGDEETGASPQELYSEEEARSAMEDARHVFETCWKLLAGDA